jgi:uncharacterized DUF497 family protein
VRHTLPGFRFTWDPHKAEANARKHGITFEQAASVFLDPFLLVVPDDHTGEDRWIAVGTTLAAHRVAVVVHTDQEGMTRLISARYATPAERQRYDRQSTR